MKTSGSLTGVTSALVLVLILQTVYIECVYRELNLHINTVHKWANNLTDYLLSISDTVTGAGYIEAYHKTKPSNELKVEKKNVKEILATVKNNIELMLKKKIDAVENLMKASEEASKKYGPYNSDLESEEVEYYNAKKLVSDDDIDDMDNETRVAITQTILYLPLKKSRPHNFNPVNMSVSTIHVPTNIYDKSSKILNGVKWTENLNNAFMDNNRNDPTLTWQYFCSSDGFFRIFPGMKWPRDPDSVDTFDCRVRKWYIEAATSSKNIIILLDASGSMKGLRMDIARNTVDKILETFSNDDFYNILQFSEDVSYVDHCFNRTLMQANADNIKRVKEKLLNIETSQIADFERALIEAFELFKSEEKKRNISLCNKAIMLVTDGATENYEWIFQKYNWPSKTVRVFTYLIGREVSDVRQVKWMACANKGHFTHISTRADVQDNVQQYVKILSRPMVQEKYHQMIWTPVYLDYPTEQVENEGLGLMTSVSIPVFDGRENVGPDEEPPNTNLLGVIGTDLPIDVLKRFIPVSKLGVNGYAFGTTNNGYILFHPYFRPFYDREKEDDNNLYIYQLDTVQDNVETETEPRPNYNSVDLSKVEISLDPVKFVQLRNAMRDPSTGSVAMNVTAYVDKMKRADTRVNHYYYNSILDTFSLAFVVPKGYGEYMLKPRDPIVPSDHEYLRSPSVHVASWIHCKNLNGGLEAVNKNFIIDYVGQGQYNSLVCDTDEIVHLVLDAKTTQNYEKIWNGELSIEEKARAYSYYSVKREYESECYAIKNAARKLKCFKNIHLKYGVELVFVGTSSGLTRFGVIADELTNPDFLGVNSETINNLYYQRAVLGWQAGYNYVFSLYNKDGLRSFDKAAVTMSTAEIVNRGKEDEVVAAAVGFQMRFSNFFQLFKNITEQCTGKDCNFTCAHSDYLNCYLVDNNAYIMTSNNNATGEFLGAVDGALMKVLIEENIYEEITFKDYQGVCKIYSSEGGSSASYIINPLKTVFNSITWFLAEVFLFITQFNVYNWFSRDYWTSGYLIDMMTGERIIHRSVIGYEACDKMVTTYALNLKTLQNRKRKGIVDSITGCGKCGEYSGSYMVRWINDTNLIMIIAAANCSCGEEEEFSIEPQKIVYNETAMCKRLWNLQQPPKYPKCYDSELEKDDNCRGNTFSISISLVLLVLFLSVKSVLT
ncbi:voltage-dependent calcium channel subunit alpha-2/delta-3 isoform X1 [Patella vulgata]|uniref:voltage-dependent calcium channel subunit alpha-2/delta-3 isoform X1 n=2 Tax=Patella vulgata TaxID=6465 RepID=UPI0021806B5F|nr:voltage-dependent calcium channel subunit alpha-2/delta-3 isoform X1 [Patella vulgata]